MLFLLSWPLHNQTCHRKAVECVVGPNVVDFVPAVYRENTPFRFSARGFSVTFGRRNVGCFIHDAMME